MWIRSQNKTILKNVNDVRIAQIRHFKDEKEYFPIVWDSWEMYDDRYLGNYSTKEKALKVLDMIQDFIGVNDVFQMPQDDEVK